MKGKIYEINTNDLDNLYELVEQQSQIEGLWFKAETAPEKLLQEALRELSSEVEHLYAHAELTEKE